MERGIESLLLVFKRSLKKNLKHSLKGGELLVIPVTYSINTIGRLV